MSESNTNPQQIQIDFTPPKPAPTEQRREKKRTRVAETSYPAYEDLIKSGQYHGEAIEVLKKIMEHGPVTCRALASMLPFEKSNVGRAVNTLINWEPSPVKIAKVAPCAITGKSVRYYSYNRPKETVQ